MALRSSHNLTDLFSDELTAVVTAIHNTPEKIVLEFAGAGSLALAWLHGVGGSSRTILEATDRYASASLTELIGFRPEQFVSRGVAVAMAAAAYQRAQLLAEPETRLVGVGCTATIATDRTKRGRHRACVAAYTAAGLLIFDLTLVKGARDRLAEEQVISRLILRAIVEASQIGGQLSFALVEDEIIETSFEPVSLLEQLLTGSIQTVMLSPVGRLSTDESAVNGAIVSGSFNPLHQGHRQMARIAARKLDRSVYFELPLLNADKPPWPRPKQFGAALSSSILRRWSSLARRSLLKKPKFFPTPFSSWATIPPCDSSNRVFITMTRPRCAPPLRLFGQPGAAFSWPAG